MVDVNQVVRETLALRAYEQRVTNITVIDALAAGLPHGVCRRPPGAAGAAEPGHQRRTGHAVGERPRHPRRAHMARRDAGIGGPRNQRRRPRHPGRTAAEDLRPVLHDEGSRQGHRPRPDGRVRDRAGARRPHSPRVATVRRRVVLRRAARHRRDAAAGAALPTPRQAIDRRRRPARRFWSSKTRRRWPRRSADALRDAGLHRRARGGRRGGAGPRGRDRRSIWSSAT